MNKIRNGTSFNDLPPEIASLIFLRVPVQDLIRSSAVSRTWHSLIKNPRFVSAQIRRSISCCNQDAVLIIPTDIKYERYCSLISAQSGLLLDKYQIPFTSSRPTNLKLVGSVNGLVCLTNDRDPSLYQGCYSATSSDVFEKTVYQNLYIWNPCLRKYKCIVSSCFRKRYGHQVKLSYALGFGFYEGCDDYRVVRIMYFDEERFNEDGSIDKFQFGGLTPRVEVFSLRMNKWRPWRGVEKIVVPRVGPKIGTTVGSTVYWLNERKSGNYSQGVWILSFDFNSEVFGQIKLPDDVCYSLGEKVDFQLLKFEGSLAVCVCKRLSIVDAMLWLISHENGIVSSTVNFQVVLNKFVKPLGITKGGALLMASLVPSIYDFNLLSFNLKSMDYQDLEFQKPLRPNVDTFFVESLCGDELLTSAK